MEHQHSLEGILNQYEAAPYPATPIEQTVQPEASQLYQHNLTTPYYLHHRRVVDATDRLILDVGCGSGLTSLTLALANPGATVIGIDISPASIEMAKARLSQFEAAQTEFYAMPIEELPQLNCQFDYINCDEVLYLLPDPAVALQTMKAALTPDGILRANLHSAIQRQHYYRAQKLFQFMGLLHPETGQTEVDLVRELLQAMPSWVNLKAETWIAEANGSFSDQMIRMNYLLQGDKGYTIPEMLTLLEAADLQLVEMVNWQQWNLAPLFGTVEQMPPFIGLSLPSLTYPQQLQIFELVHPIHRLLDFWCTHADSPAANQLNILETSALERRSLEIHPNDLVYLHPQLCSDVTQQALQAAAQQNRPFDFSQHLDLPAAQSITVDGNLAACLLTLWSAPQSVIALAQRWQQIRPIHPCTLEPVSLEAALQEITHLLAQMLPDLYVLIESPE